MGPQNFEAGRGTMRRWGLHMGEDTSGVAKWEIYSLATMLIVTHGDAAEEKAELEIAAAREANHIGNLTVWAAVRAKLDQIRDENNRRDS
jgi:hypothetical protein